MTNRLNNGCLCVIKTRWCHLKREALVMNEEEAFRSMFHELCKDAGFVILRDYPLYEITNGFCRVSLRIIEPFALAEIENLRKIKEAVPRKVLENVKREFSKKQKWRKEKETSRFSRILLSCAKQILLLNDNPLNIVKIKTLLQLTKKTYSSLKIDVDELNMFGRALDSGMLQAELFPGRDPSDFVIITSAKGEKKRYALVRFKRYDLVENDE